MKIARYKDMSAFVSIWIGQVVSIIGTGLTGFVLGLQVYQKTGSVTQYTLIAMFTVLPGIVISPFSGVLVDRYDRKKVMIFSNLIASISIFFIVVMFYMGDFKVSIIYLSMAICSVCSAFQVAAYTASISLLVPKKHLVRANGMVQIGDGVSKLIAPLLAGFLSAKVDIWAVIIIDFITFLIAILSCLVAEVPLLEKKDSLKKKDKTFLMDASVGWNYIKERPGLVMLLFFFSIINYFVTTVTILATPLALSFTTPAVLGAVLSIAGFGMIVGSGIVILWGGPEHKILGIMSIIFIIGICLVTAGLKPSIPLVTISAFLIFFFVPIQQSCSNAIWQSKVHLDLQGRVFSIRRMVSQIAIPLAYITSGPLVEYVFGPLLKTSIVRESIGSIIGIGKGREIGLMFIFMGITTMVVSILGYKSEYIRNIETELPDVV
ncbi:MFS transporter [Clostridium cellulovorans]|uniref:Major facilitator superfamily MFS_1 n=1 Tax=Clostridium cellulovorans (strain ATCC 35296 / DSM 3052 / OCM 3 / 743B) TaxID=573061 RepID=D9SLG8_CLOC7|nr:MFS transporter [Clostridium cellulovorans]ADL53605.1 major facilitator superfamily MFS_1 [Clostridium cellulovorans 743B]